MADYSWLPQRYHATFQPMLELDDGIALLHFASEIVMITVPDNPARASQQSSSSLAHHPQRGHVAETTILLLLSPDALYFCGPTGDILTTLLVDTIDSVLVCDHWLCFCVPSRPRDTVFAIVSPHSSAKGSGGSPVRVRQGRDLPQSQKEFIATFNRVRALKDLSGITPMVLDSHYAIVSRLQQPPRPSRRNNSGHPAAADDVAPPIPFLSFEDIRTEVIRPNDLIDVFTFPHRLACPRLESWELEREERARRARAAASPPPQQSLSRRIVVERRPQVPSNDVRVATTHLSSANRAQRLANLLDDDDDVRPKSARTLNALPHHAAQRTAALSDDDDDTTNNSLLAAIRMHGEKQGRWARDDVRPLLRDYLADSGASASMKSSYSFAQDPQQGRHIDPSSATLVTSSHIGLDAPGRRSDGADVHNDALQFPPPPPLPRHDRRTSDATTAGPTIEMLLSSNASVEGSPLPQPVAHTPKDHNVVRPRQRNAPTIAEARRQQHVTAESSTPSSARPKGSGFMTPTSSAIARRDAAATERRRADELRAIQLASEQLPKLAAAPARTTRALTARPRPSPPRVQVSPVRHVDGSPQVAAQHGRQSSPKSTAPRTPLPSTSTIGREGLMLVWQELKTQKETLDAITRHVEALVIEAPTSADGHRRTSPPSSSTQRRQRSLSPQQQLRHDEAVDQQYHNVVDRLESLSAFQRDLLLRPLPEHHPGMRTSPQNKKTTAATTSGGLLRAGGPSVQQRVDDLVRAAAPERKLLAAAPLRAKAKMQPSTSTTAVRR